jgi:hypothetical protein
MLLPTLFVVADVVERRRFEALCLTKKSVTRPPSSSTRITAKFANVSALAPAMMANEPCQSSAVTVKSSRSNSGRLFAKEEGVLLENSQVFAEACKSTNATVCVASAAIRRGLACPSGIADEDEVGRDCCEVGNMGDSCACSSCTRNAKVAGRVVLQASYKHIRTGKFAAPLALYLKVRLGDVRNWEPSVFAIDGGALERVLQLCCTLCRVARRSAPLCVEPIP